TAVLGISMNAMRSSKQLILAVRINNVRALPLSIRNNHLHRAGASMSDIPTSLRYTEDHLWARHEADGGVVRVGITDFAQESLGDVVAVTLPKVGTAVQAGEACGDIESVKSVSDLIAPVTGTVRASNDTLDQTPEVINTDP